MLKAQNTWFYYDRSSGKYIYSNSDNGGTPVGCFHLLMDSFRRFDDAAEEAEEYDGGFVAWIDGEYQVRVGAYLSKEDALDAADELGEGEVVGTSAYAVTVIQTGTDRVLFQFDGGGPGPGHHARRDRRGRGADLVPGVQVPRRLPL